MALARIRFVVGGLIALASSLLAADAASEEVALTRQRIAELVAGAPLVRVANAEVRVARSAVDASGLVSTENPVISGLGGVRFNPDDSRSLAAVATLSFPVDLGGS